MWLRVALFLAIVFILMVLVYARAQWARAPAPAPVARTPSFEETWQEMDTTMPSPKADKLLIGLPDVPPPKSVVTERVPAPPPVAIMPQSRVSAESARTEGDRFCELYGMHKESTRGGKSWRCRH